MSLGLTALLEHACIIHLATIAGCGALSRTEPTTAASRGKQRAAEGDGKEDEGRKRKVTERCFMWWVRICAATYSTQLKLQPCTGWTSSATQPSLKSNTSFCSSFQQGVEPTNFLWPSAELSPHLEIAIEVGGSLLSHGAVTRAKSRWNI